MFDHFFTGKSLSIYASMLYNILLNIGSVLLYAYSNVLPLNSNPSLIIASASAYIPLIIVVISNFLYNI